MTPKWHRLMLYCPRCDKKATIVDVSSCSDGEVLLEMVCVTCGIFLNWKTTIASLVARAVKADYEESMVKIPPLKFPLKSKGDTAFLHDLGISEEE